jgi:hypothetical protein
LPSGRKSCLACADAFADVKSIREAMDRRRAPFYLRRN